MFNEYPRPEAGMSDIVLSDITHKMEIASWRTAAVTPRIGLPECRPVAGRIFYELLESFIRESENNPHYFVRDFIFPNITIFCEYQQWKKHLFGEMRHVPWREWKRYRTIS